MARAVRRALSILDVFDGRHPALSLFEIGDATRISKATVFRHVRALEEAGFLLRLENQKYCLSPKLVRLASLVPINAGLREIARPVMQEVNRRTGETITLNIRERIERVCIEVVDTPSPLMAIVRPGERVPLLFGATGRILLAHMSEEERRRLTRSAGAKLDAAKLDAELARFQKQGYALTASQRVPGVTAIAVPIRDPYGSVAGCIALTGPSIRVDARVKEFSEIMLRAGHDISSRLGNAAALSSITPASTATPTRSAKRKKRQTEVRAATGKRKS